MSEGMIRFQSFVESHEWVFAKTMPRNPHFYLVRKRTLNPLEFDWAAKFIESTGITERYKGYPYEMLYCGGHRYWTMARLNRYRHEVCGEPMLEPEIINRKEL